MAQRQNPEDQDAFDLSQSVLDQPAHQLLNQIDVSSASPPSSAILSSPVIPSPESVFRPVSASTRPKVRVPCSAPLKNIEQVRDSDSDYEVKPKNKKQKSIKKEGRGKSQRRVGMSETQRTASILAGFVANLNRRDSNRRKPMGKSSQFEKEYQFFSIFQGCSNIQRMPNLIQGEHIHSQPNLPCPKYYLNFDARRPVLGTEGFIHEPMSIRALHYNCLKSISSTLVGPPGQSYNQIRQVTSTFETSSNYQLKYDASQPERPFPSSSNLPETPLMSGHPVAFGEQREPDQRPRQMEKTPESSIWGPNGGLAAELLEEERE